MMVIRSAFFYVVSGTILISSEEGETEGICCTFVHFIAENAVSSSAAADIA